MHFENTTALLLLVSIPVIVILFIWWGQQRQQRLLQFADAALVPILLSGVSPRRRWIQFILWLMALVALILALARPVWGVAEEIVEAQGIALIVVLDTSTSMDAQDVLPSRLERAKRTARELFQGAEGNQLGLVLFAGSAFVQVPLTTDAAAALTFLDAASTQSISRQGTALADALALALETFDERIVSNGIIVVLSDGENHVGDPVAMAEAAAQAGLTIHAIGYGNPVDGEPIPILNPDGTFSGEYKADASGNLVLTRLDEPILEQVAEVTGGTYQRSSDSGIEVVNLLNMVRDVEGNLLERRLETRQVERFEIFVGIALLALTINLALGYMQIGLNEN
jgi:Ca-activated chloride channel family protein